jgi:hypothetical protein
MNMISRAMFLLYVAASLIFAQSIPTSAQVIVNNVFSPFTTIQVEPGYRAYGAPTWWLHNPRHHQRCYRRWDSYFGEWRGHCVRMEYWRERPYWESRNW